MSIQTIKANIKTNLDELVTAGTLGAAISTDIKRSPLSADFPAFPCAILMPPALESQVLDNRTVTRTYAFDIMIVVNAEDITDTIQVENMIEAVISKFDNDPTLGGAAEGGVLPVSSAPEPFQHNGRDLIMVIMQIEAKQAVSLTFS